MLSSIKFKLIAMLNLLAYTPSPTLRIHFVNRESLLFGSVRRDSPSDFLNAARIAVQNRFDIGPTTRQSNFRDLIAQSLASSSRKSKVARYIFIGNADRDHQSITAAASIADMIRSRPEPGDNPITFITTGNIGWIDNLDKDKNTGYVSALSGYDKELRQIQAQHGDTFPFTRGAYLVLDN
jgi:hypothetical protein